MSLISSVLFPLAAILFLSCADPAAAEPLAIRPLAKGGFSGILEPTEQVIKDKATWEKVWSKHSTRSTKADEAPEVDFAREMVIVVTMGRKNSGGYSVEVAKVEPAGETLKICVVRKTPRPGSMTLQALTAPFHMVAVPRSDLEPKFIDQE